MDRVEQLITALLEGCPDERREAALALGHSGDHRAVGPLIWVLNYPDDRVWGYAVDALRQLGAPAVPPLCALLEGRASPEARLGAATCLGLRGDPRGAAYLCEALQGARGPLASRMAATLSHIVEDHGVADLRSVVPSLKRLLAPWSGESAAARAIYRKLLSRVQAGGADLPLPASPEAPAPDALPRPASAEGPPPEDPPASPSRARSPRP